MVGISPADWKSECGVGNRLAHSPER